MHNPAQDQEADLTAQQHHQRILENQGIDNGGSIRKLKTAKGLHHLIQEQGFKTLGHEELEDFWDRAGYTVGIPQAQRRMALFDLPEAPFAGTDISWRDLDSIGSHFRAHRDEDELLALIERARGDESIPPLRKKRAEREKKPSELANKAIKLFTPLMACLAVLFAKINGCFKDHKWVAQLDDAVCNFLFWYAAQRGVDPAVLYKDRRTTARGGGENGICAGALQDESPNDQPALDTKPDGSAGPAGTADGRAADQGAGPEPDPYEQVLGYRVARALVAHVTEEEKPELQRHLVLTLMKREPHHLVSYVRGISRRMTGEPEAVRKDVEDFLGIAANLDIDKRWTDIFNVFISAQLPEFLENLHWLGEVPLGPAQREALEAALAYWPTPRPAPPPVPEGAEPETWARLAHLPELAFLYQEMTAYFARPGMAASPQAMGTLWVELRELLDSMDSLGRLVIEQLQKQEAPGPQPA